MLNNRIVILTLVLTLVAAGTTFFVMTASAATPEQSEAPACPIVHPSSFSTEALRDILNGRYERRVGLPR